MNTKIIILIILLFMVAKIKSQTTNPLDERYRPPKSSIFGTNNALKIKKNREGDALCHNFLRFSFSDFASSQARLVYERRFYDKIAATVSLGTVYGFDYIQMYVAGDELYEDFSSYNNIDAIKLPYLLENSSIRGGYLFSSSIKYSLGEDFSSSPFLEICYKYVLRNYETNDRIQNMKISDRDFTSDFKYFSVNCGYDWVYGEGRTRFTHELSIGVGMKLYFWDRYDLIHNIQTGSYRYDKNNEMKMSYKCPFFSLTYQMGLGW